MRQKFILLLSLYSASCLSAIYMEKNDQGGITFSDTPLSHSTTVKLQSVNTVSAPPAAQAPTISSQLANEKQIPAAAEKNYQTFSFIKPQNGETLTNQPVIQVEFRIEPELRKSDLIQLYLDDKPYGTPRNTPKFEITQLERGTHKLRASIINNQKILKESGSISIFIHRNSVILQKSS